MCANDATPRALAVEGRPVRSKDRFLVFGAPDIRDEDIEDPDVARDWTRVAGKTGSRTVFCVGDRTYLKQRTRFERRLIRFLLPDAKFLPVG